MKRISTVFLKIVIILAAIAVLGALIWFPPSEGRAANLDLIGIYGDPLVIYSFFAAIPFFIGLHQAFKLLNFIDDNKAFSKGAINTLKNMKYASISMVVLIALAVLSIRLFIQGDDPAGPTMLGVLLIVLFGVIATAAGIFQRLFQNAVDLKSENDLTV